MRVLLINTNYGRGGASQIVVNLATKFRQMGVKTNTIVASTDNLADAYVRVIGKRRRFIERISNRICSQLGLSNNGILNTFWLRKDPDILGMDIVNLHNLHGGYFNFLALPGLTHRIPAVLTLHDMWPFTGHCVYSFDCEKWRTGCGMCPYPTTYQSIQRDATYLECRLKRRSFQSSNLHIVAISRWIYNLAENSLLSGLPIHFIPNGIDLKAYQPMTRKAAQQKLGIPKNRHIILYVAHSLNDPRKGFDILIKALNSFPVKLRTKCILLVMGRADEVLHHQINMDIVSLGYIREDERKVQAFAASDVVVFPTRADNLPVVLQESMACGRPMISFSVGGVPELVRNGITGFAVPPENVEQFSKSLRLLIENDNLRVEMGRNCRVIAEKEYSLCLQAQRYKDLFEEIVSTKACQ